ncbi:MAG: hypothetical protein EOO45_14790 [Flavobacterium sp.]|nr:MAG: hypothetical protein EOO45_14790 [Flavobacterium sp.]
MKTFFIALLVSISFISASQAQTEKRLPETQFRNDLETGRLKIYLLGGIAGMIKTSDRDFAVRYNFSYHDFGCVAPPDLKFYAEYNILVMHHLGKECGKDFSDNIRQEVLGWKKWKEEK